MKAAQAANTTAEGKTFRPVSQPNAGAGIEFVRPSKLEGPGLIVEGIYMGSIPNHFDDSKLDYKFERSNGTAVVINSTGQLASQMKNVEVGTLCRVEYKGKEKIKKGKMAGKEAHNFEVLIAD